MATRVRKNPIDPGAPASVVAALFGGAFKLATAIGRTPSTIDRWLVKGHIPGQDQTAILAAAAAADITIPATAFVDTRSPEQRSADRQSVGLE